MYLSCLLVTSVLHEMSRPLGMGLTTSMIGSDGPEGEHFHCFFMHIYGHCRQFHNYHGPAYW